jgi:hypothetical protein
MALRAPYGLATHNSISLVFVAIFPLCAAGLALYGTVALVEWMIERRMGMSITSREF